MKMNMDYRVEDCLLFEVPTFIDGRGAISVMDKELPFDVKRVFWLYHIPEGKERGAHALLQGSEMMFSLHGSCIVDLFDGENRNTVLLDDPKKGLLIRPGIWFVVHSSKNDGVTLVLASEEYGQEKYVCDYENFVRLKSNN